MDENTQIAEEKKIHNNDYLLLQKEFWCKVLMQ